MFNVHYLSVILLFSIVDISDFDEDDMISSRDLKEVVDRLTGDQRLEDEDMQQLIDNVRTASVCIVLSMYL